MAGNPATVPTPGANDPNGGNPVITPALIVPGNSPTPTPKPGEFILSQEQFDKRWGEKMTALETEIGMPIKDLKPFIERNKPKSTPTGEMLSGADLKIAKMEALMTAGVPSKQIPLLLQYLNISGKTREELDTSIQGLITAKLLVIEAPGTVPATQPGNNPTQPPAAANGAGNTGVPGTSAKKIWKESEIKELRLSGKLDDKTMDEIKVAMSEGRVQ